MKIDGNCEDVSTSFKFFDTRRDYIIWNTRRLLIDTYFCCDMNNRAVDCKIATTMTITTIAQISSQKPYNNYWNCDFVFGHNHRSLLHCVKKSKPKFKLIIFVCF